MSRTNCASFDCTSIPWKKATPVTLPPGRAKDSISPHSTGNALAPNITIGIDFVARAAETACNVLNAVRMSTFSRTRSS